MSSQKLKIIFCIKWSYSLQFSEEDCHYHLWWNKRYFLFPKFLGLKIFVKGLKSMTFEWMSKCLKTFCILNVNSVKSLSCSFFFSSFITIFMVGLASPGFWIRIILRTRSFSLFGNLSASRQSHPHTICHSNRIERLHQISMSVWFESLV